MLSLGFAIVAVWLVGEAAVDGNPYLLVSACASAFFSWALAQRAWWRRG